MRYEFKLPDLAEGMVEGELVGWLVAVGDRVKAEQPVAEVMTDKATVVIPSPVAGTVLELPWQSGDIVKVGQALIIFDAEGAAVPANHDVVIKARPDVLELAERDGLDAVRAQLAELLEKAGLAS